MTHFQNFVAVDEAVVYERVNELERRLKAASEREKREWFDRERARIVRRGIWPFRKDYLRTEAEIEKIYSTSTEMFVGSPKYEHETRYHSEIEWLWKIYKMAQKSAEPRKVYLVQKDFERMFYD